MITQCSIRQLYTLTSIPASQKDALIAIAKIMERRRCNHHTLDNPLSTLECLSSVIDPKKSGANRAHVVVASQEEEVRRWCRGVRGVPLVYVKRSVMIMEPMAESSMSVREGIERGKFRTGLRARGLGLGTKRKREDEGRHGEGIEAKKAEDGDQGAERAAKKKKVRGPKGPNPLSIKKAKKEKAIGQTRDEDRALSNENSADTKDRNSAEADPNIIEASRDEAQDAPTRRKRKRKHKADKTKELWKEVEAVEHGQPVGSD